MKKKEYIKPGIEIVAMESMVLMAASNTIKESGESSTDINNDTAEGYDPWEGAY